MSSVRPSASRTSGASDSRTARPRPKRTRNSQNQQNHSNTLSLNLPLLSDTIAALHYLRGLVPANLPPIAHVASLYGLLSGSETTVDEELQELAKAGTVRAGSQRTKRSAGSDTGAFLQPTAVSGDACMRDEDRVRWTTLGQGGSLGAKNKQGPVLREPRYEPVAHTSHALLLTSSSIHPGDDSIILSSDYTAAIRYARDAWLRDHEARVAGDTRRRVTDPSSSSNSSGDGGDGVDSTLVRFEMWDKFETLGESWRAEELPVAEMESAGINEVEQRSLLHHGFLTLLDSSSYHLSVPNAGAFARAATQSATDVLSVLKRRPRGEMLEEPLSAKLSHLPRPPPLPLPHTLSSLRGLGLITHLRTPVGALVQLTPKGLVRARGMGAPKYDMRRVKGVSEVIEEGKSRLGRVGGDFE
ncbi:hypothetical protein HDU93_007851 [Gonapodya sp. JEL0774]|nr:hypothetical protein HDU93_007851 [Gonapodya sp. JEL0774]